MGEGLAVWKRLKGSPSKAAVPRAWWYTRQEQERYGSALPAQTHEENFSNLTNRIIRAFVV